MGQVTAFDLPALLAGLANGGLRHIAGAVDTQWPAAAMALAEDELETGGGGRLAVLATPLPREPWRVDATLRRVRDRGYRGLAVPGAQDLDAGARRLADRIGLTVLSVDRPFELAETCWRLALARDAVVLDLVRRVTAAFRYPAADLADLLGHLAAATASGVALLDASGVLEERGGELGDWLAERSDLLQWDRWTDLLHTPELLVATVRVDSPSRPGLRLAFFAHGIGDSQLDALAAAAQIAMPAVAARILVDEVATVTDASVSSDLLRDFLELGDTFDTDVDRRMIERGWRTAGHHLGFRVIGRSRVDGLALLRAVGTALTALGIEWHASIQGRGVTAWLRFVPPPSPRDLERHVHQLRAVHENLRRSFNVASGVGSLQADRTGLVTTLGEAADAARIAAERSANNFFVRVDGLGLEQLLLARTENDTFLPAAESLLAPLRGIDPAAGRGEEDVLLVTLTSYLDHESGIAATAEALGVHRNTVTSRVQRIQEILGVDMHDPGVRLALHLACRAVLR